LRKEDGMLKLNVIIRHKIGKRLSRSGYGC
jgi:hypothetical protein